MLRCRSHPSSCGIAMLSAGRRWHGGSGEGVRDDGSHCKEKARTQRDPRFAVVEERDIAMFRSLLGPKGVVEEPVAVKVYNTDWFKEYHGTGCVALTPSSCEEVSAVLRYCSERRLAVVPQGGNTGFVGGSVPVFDEVVVSLKRMNKTHHIDTLAATLTCEAGCVLESLDQQLSAHRFMMPVDLGAKGSCHIGGNVSTAAGGLRFMRYGSLHGNVLGLRVVLPSGEILDLMNTLKKDNTGYDLKQLFIGAEGTLGIVTDVALQLAPLPVSTQTMFLAARDWEQTCNLFRQARADLGEILSAVEMIDGETLEIVLNITKAPSPLPSEGSSSSTAPYYLLMETHGSNATHDREKLMAFLASAEEKGLIVSGTIAESGAQAAHMWKLREQCALAPQALGHVRWYDISMPSGSMDEVIQATKAELLSHGLGHDRCRVIGFGHLGDGNLHINVVTMPSFDARVAAIVDRFIYDLCKRRRYSVSAEHGIGLQKRGVLTFTKREETVAWMRRFKAMIDPQGIMNPYKVFGPVTEFGSSSTVASS